MNEAWQIKVLPGPYGRGDLACWQAAATIDQQYSYAPWNDAAWQSITGNYMLAVIGTAAVWHAFALWQMGEDGAAHLINLTVHPDQRHQGLATRLVKAYQQNASCHSIYLEVAEDNEAAYQLYLKLGFTPLCRKKAFYHQGTAAWAMQWVRPSEALQSEKNLLDCP